MNFLDTIKATAKKVKKTVVLPETNDIRTIRAAEQIIQEDLAALLLIGNKDEVLKMGNAAILEKASFLDPCNYEKLPELAGKLYELRKKKGMTEEEANNLLLTNPLYLAVMLVKEGYGDGMVAGAANATADVLRPALQILKTEPGTKLVSTFFVMEIPQCELGNNGMFMFADCALNQNPNSEELAEIAISTAKTFKRFTGQEANVALLSHSSKGSAKHPDVDKVAEAVAIANKTAPELQIDGEFQLDAAIIPEVAKQKAPNSLLAGKANVLVFPDLDAANIGYKLVQRLGKADAYGPITQGIAKPVNDLSRGCSAEDIVGVVAFTAVQAQ